MKWLVLSFWLLAAPAWAQVTPGSCSTAKPCPVNVVSGSGATPASPSYSKPAQYTPLSSSQYALSVTTATTLTVPTGALYATVAVEGGSVRYSTTTTPTASTGSILGTSTSGAPYWFDVPLSSLSFIATSGSGTTIDVEYFK